VRAKTKTEAEQVGKYMIRPILALERLTFLEPEGKIGYRYGQDAPDQETMDYLEFVARVTAHIPDKGQVTEVALMATEQMRIIDSKLNGSESRATRETNFLYIKASCGPLSRGPASKEPRTGPDSWMNRGRRSGSPDGRRFP
jgi:hypothetical protein